ncbi:MAG: hypothetical protein QM621_11170 [Aeromicrobium sp.]|uniref:hypothetical protein n=1 Tax=Aeromicrobium sp. TaxID=1871063 RepID=UPI0039E71582
MNKKTVIAAVVVLLVGGVTAFWLLRDDEPHPDDLAPTRPAATQLTEGLAATAPVELTDDELACTADILTSSDLSDETLRLITAGTITVEGVTPDGETVLDDDQAAVLATLLPDVYACVSAHPENNDTETD